MTEYKQKKGLFRRIQSVRFWLIRSHLTVTFIASLLVFISLQALLLFYPEGLQLTVGLTVLITLKIFILGFLTSIYVGYKDSYYVKKRLEDISTFIATLSRGKFSETIQVREQDELGRLTEDINQLAQKIQNQVHSLQKLAEEKNLLAKKAHSAATMEERQRLARDLHDSVSQQLFALSIMSSAVIRIFDSKPEIAKRQIQDIASIAAKAQAEMRALLLHLRPVSLTNETLCRAIEQLIEELERKTPITFHRNIETLNTLSNATEDHLFRIIQEALANILRHADASEVDIEIHEKNDYVYIFISDNGIGFELNQQKLASYGLQTMRERCEEIGGTFEIKSKQGEGTHIEIHIPVRKRGRNNE
ncbi:MULTISPECIES: sensor histidine kinase [Bacillus]|uniref:sensor histidine kinase n=1 Tax=Bacillus TaxID=1386 RepID=UPI001D0D0FC2|nr:MULTISPECIES: sensor histidine kinase [Bacillus]